MQAYSDTEPYDLTVTASSAISAETEFNDSAGQANTLSSGVTMNGHLSSASDIDYFKISVGSSGTLEIQTSGYPSADVEVLNPSQQLIGTGTISGTRHLFCWVCAIRNLLPSRSHESQLIPTLSLMTLR